MIRIPRETTFGLLCLSLSLVLLLIVGCTVLEPRPAKPLRTYLLDIKAPEAILTLPSSLELKDCLTRSPFGDQPLVYRLNQVRYERDRLHTFLVAPRDQVDVVLQQWLVRAQQNPPVNPRDGSLWVLQPTLESLLADFSHEGQPQAEVQMHFRLSELTDRGRTQRVVFDERWTLSEPLALAPGAEDIVAAQSRCLEKIFGHLQEALKQSFTGGD